MYVFDVFTQNYTTPIIIQKKKKFRSYGKVNLVKLQLSEMRISEYLSENISSKIVTRQENCRTYKD